MNHPLAILRDSFLALIVVVSAAAWLGGASVALGAALMGVVAAGNLALLAVVVRRLTGALAAEDPASVQRASVLLVLKVPVLLGVFLVLAQFVDVLGLALGLLVVPASFAVGAVAWLLSPVPAEAAPAAPQES